MMAEALSEQTGFQENLQSLYLKLLEADSLQKFRARSWDHFLELGLPDKKSEAFRYLRLRQLYSRLYESSQVRNVSFSEMAKHVIPECSNSVLIFVNGSYAPSLSNTKALPAKMIIVGLKEAMKTYGTFLTNQWGRSLKEEMDPFAALNGALHSEGAFIYVPPKTVIEAPVQILHLVHTDNEAMLLCPRVHLFLGPQSELHLYSNQGIISEMQGFVNSVVECAIEEEAHLVYTQMAFDEPGEVWHFDAFRANLKRNSTLKTICATAGGPSTRFDYRVALTGENGEAQLNGAWMLNKKNEAHIHVVVDHQAPYCRSMQLYKGVNNEFSHSSFEGKILVRQPAQKTEAFQLNNNLLLSDYAIADSKPNLEIFADDVKASHGATVGQLDNEQLFYMKARGFSLREAQNLLVAGFCKEVTDQIELPSLAKNLNYRMDQYLAG